MLFLAVDLGTTGCKSIAFSESGHILSESYIEYSLITTEEGYIEQDADLWWSLVKYVVKQVVGRIGNESKKIKALSISSQGISFVPVGVKGNILSNAICWLDSRAVKQADFLREKFGEKDIFQRTGKRISPVYVLPKIMWLRENIPEIYDKTWKFMMGLDYINYRLTGEVLTDHTMAGGTMGYNISTKLWDMDILNACGIDLKKLPIIEYSGFNIGKILPNIALEVGIPEDTMIILGAQDQKCAAIGSGIDTGICTISLGTATAICVKSNYLLLDYGMRIPCFTLDNNSWILEAVISTSGVGLKWFRDNFLRDKSYIEMDEIVKNTLPGAKGIYFYPHFEGASSPYWETKEKGFIYGLNLSTTIGEILRALYEGIAYQIKSNIDVLEGLGAKINEIRLFGGGARSSIWCSIISDMTGKPINILYTAETANLGAAVIAASGIGACIHSTELIAKTILPDKDMVQLYNKGYEKYIEKQRKIFDN